MQFHGDCHTHMNALCHIAYKWPLYNGRPATSVNVCSANEYEITTYTNGSVGLGVLIDVPHYRGVKWLKPGETVTREEIEDVERAEGVRLEEGDMMVFRTGHHRGRLELGAWDPSYKGQGRAGLDPYSLTLLRKRRVSVFLPDGDGEIVPSYVEGIQYQYIHFRLLLWGWYVRIVFNWRSWQESVKKKVDLNLW